MKNSGGIGGYTVVEVMIFLAITALIFASAMIAVDGQQEKTRFAQGVRDIDSKIQTVIADVANGFYPRVNEIDCDFDGSSLRIRLGTNEQGTNEECAFIGKMFQFGSNGTDDRGYNVFSLASRRRVGNREVTELGREAAPAAVTPAGADLTEVNELRSGVQATGLYTLDGVELSMVGFINGFGQYRGEGLNFDLVSNAHAVSMVATVGPSTGLTQGAAAARLTYSSTGDTEFLDENSQANAANGVVLCLRSGEQRGAIIIGGSGRQIVTTVALDAPDMPLVPHTTTEICPA